MSACLCLSSLLLFFARRLVHALFQLAAWRHPCLMHVAGLRSRAWGFLAEIPRLGFTQVATVHTRVEAEYPWKLSDGGLHSMASTQS